MKNKIWFYSSIGDLEFNSQSGQASLYWRDEEKNTILRATLNDIVFFQQSADELGGYELTLAYELSITKIYSRDVLNYLENLGYTGAGTSFPNMFHLHVESDVMLDVVCKNISITPRPQQ